MPDETLLQPSPQFPQTSVQITNEGLLISIALAPGLSINQGINSATMIEIARQVVRSHPELQNELIQETVAAKRGQLELIKSINASRND